LLANLLAVVASRTLSNRHEQVADQTPESLVDNFVGNIVGKTTCLMVVVAQLFLLAELINCYYE